jgi:hypothetical protein
MKNRNRAVIFTLSSLLTIGVLNYNEYETKAKATTNQNIKEKKEIHITEQLVEIPKSHLHAQTPLDQFPSLKEKAQVVEEVHQPETYAKPSVKGENTVSEENTVNIESETKANKKEIIIPEKRMIDGLTYVNIMDSKSENLADLIDISNKHHATLYAIEFSDSFAMFGNKTGEPVMMFSTGFRSVSTENVNILYDMHPDIKEQIKQVVDTGKEIIVEMGEFESYHVSKTGETIKLSF